MTTLDRREFADMFEREMPGLGEEGSALWIPETEQIPGEPSRWFVMIPRTPTDNHIRKWTLQNCKGLVRCYSSGEYDEWWGFTHKGDIPLFLLRWSNGGED